MNFSKEEKLSDFGASHWRDTLLLLHYWLPVALGWSLAHVIQHATGAAFFDTGLAILLAGIGAAYSFDRIIDSTHGEEKISWLKIALYGGVVVGSGTIIFLVATTKVDIHLLGIIAILSGASLVYSRLKQLPLFKTAVVAVAWTWACFALPLNGSRCNWLYLDVTFPLILMIAAGCILCDLKDAEEDRAMNIPSLPVLFGIRAT